MSGDAEGWYMYNDNDIVNEYGIGKGNGLSVRCVR